LPHLFLLLLILILVLGLRGLRRGWGRGRRLLVWRQVHVNRSGQNHQLYLHKFNNMSYQLLVVLVAHATLKERSPGIITKVTAGQNKPQKQVKVLL
jgi:hypothetical protein